ncbi:MAG: DUF3800 domain-containing protein, partial [Candidatus Ratteibacteria bacterium]
MVKATFFIDETGDHDLINIDKHYPIFGLLGVIFNNDYYSYVVEPEFNKFKSSFLSGTDVILHSREIVRSIGNFSFCKDSVKRKYFYEGIENLLEELDYVVVFSIIDKKEYRKIYQNPYDTYSLTLNFLVERFYFYLKENDINGEIIAESRNRKLDELINLEYERITKFGTFNKKVKSYEILARIKDFKIKEKKWNIPGLQIADLVASQLGRNHLSYERYWGFSLENKL